MNSRKRIVIIGRSCAGKTTFSSDLAAKLKIKHIELDALHWNPNWKEADELAFRSRVQIALNQDSWIVDGNYMTRLKDLVWQKADTQLIKTPPPGLEVHRLRSTKDVRNFLDRIYIS